MRYGSGMNKRAFLLITGLGLGLACGSGQEPEMTRNPPMPLPPEEPELEPQVEPEEVIISLDDLEFGDGVISGGPKVVGDGGGGKLTPSIDKTTNPPRPYDVVSVVGVSTTADLSAGPEEVVDKTVRRSIGQLKYCHEKALKEDPTVIGRLDIEAEVSEGRVQSTKVGETPTEDLGRCVEEKVKRWRFPEDTEGRVTLKVDFTTE